MAVIPMKAKTNTTEDNGISFEMLVIVLGAVMFLNRIFENRVHSSLSTLLMVVLIGVVVYLFLPNKRNRGKNGYLRLLICMKYMIHKIKERIYKHV